MESKPIIASGDTVNGQPVIIAEAANEFAGMSNSQLRYLIRYTDKKNEAGEQLLKQSPSNSDLCYLIRFGTPYTDKKNEAWGAAAKAVTIEQ
jgi:hypothetical protein